MTSQLHGPRMSDREFQKFSEFIYAECGINLVPAKKTMLTVRLTKRLRALGMDSFSRYLDFVFGPEGGSQELIHMIDVVTTNKTDFFREPRHFDFLMNQALPTLVQSKSGTSYARLNIWSAGCSSGEESYTLAMVLADFFEKNRCGDFSILATDISTRVLKVAQQGIYPETAVEPVPSGLKKKYLMRGKSSRKGFARVVPELRKHVTFRRLNLIGGRNFGIKSVMDIIFCRNVIIYFDRPTQKTLFEKFYDQLMPGGFMFIGHSESLHGVHDRFIPLGRSIYQKPE